MKYVFLLVILLLLASGLYYANKQYDQFFLITETWETTEEPKNTLLVSITDNKTKYYEFSAATGFVDMVKKLWLIGALFIGVTIILIPLSIYSFKTIWNRQLSDAKQSVINANAKAKKAGNDSEKEIYRIQEHCDSMIKRAYKEQLNVVKNELSEKLTMIEYREETVTGKELVAENTKREADISLSQYRSEYQKLKSDFEEKEKLFTKSRNNAVATMNRRKRKSNTKVTV